MQEKYVPSGISSIQGFIITLCLGIIGAVVVPIVYIILGRLIPNIWFIAIISVLFGFAVALFIDLGIKIGKVRSKKTAVGIGVFCGLLSYYLQWVVFDALMYSPKGFTFNLGSEDLKMLLKDIFYLFVHPNILFGEICNINEVGSFRIKGSGNVKGALLWVIWAAEFLVIVGSTIYGVVTGKVMHPFSESNDEWMEKRKTSIRIPVVNDKETFVTRLQNGDHKILENEPALATADSYAEVNIFESNGDSMKYLTVFNVQNTRKKKDLKKMIVVKFLPLYNSNI
ncbi:MAG: hypothetical protein DI598_16965 [Pseudopedobacter saltans]|uniref:Uncharacterized protein n=1 Tax=Pseudopedobacter saltans TaxID=151895 RepID=A0A2W5GJK0_9SPHI|nr:MAG: hypothetical protein DI598_16965 [Pseudopedobacter saltans]